MAELKKVWKQTAKSFILAFNDLGISLFQSAKAGVDLAVEWAKKDNPHVEAEGSEIPMDEPAPQSEPETEAEPEPENASE